MRVFELAGPPRLSGRHADRHARRGPRRGRGEARPGGRDRPLAAAADEPAGAGGGVRDRRGRIRWRAGDRRRRPGADAAERHLHGDLAGGLRGDPLEGRRRGRKAAAALRPTARACLDLGVVDAIVPEPSGGAHRDHDRAAGCWTSRSGPRWPRSRPSRCASAVATGAPSTAPWACGAWPSPTERARGRQRIGRVPLREGRQRLSGDPDAAHLVRAVAHRAVAGLARAQPRQRPAGGAAAGELRLDRPRGRLRVRRWPMAARTRRRERNRSSAVSARRIAFVRHE